MQRDQPVHRSCGWREPGAYWAERVKQTMVKDIQKKKGARSHWCCRLCYVCSDLKHEKPLQYFKQRHDIDRLTS